MRAHKLDSAVQRQRRRDRHEERHAIGEVVALRKVEVPVEAAAAGGVEEAPDARLAEARAREGDGVVRIAETEGRVVTAVEGADGAREGDHVRRKQDVLGVALVKGLRARLVRRRARIALGNARGHPDGPLHEQPG